MLNSLLEQLRRYKMLEPGDRVICAVSGGADSMALLWGMYLLQKRLGIHLEAAHFNHGLRGQESQRDEDFVRGFCADYHIPLTVGQGQVKPGKKGLEAAAREARYAFLRSLNGKIATAHTADDNAETLLMHLIRGTGLRGLGGIAPVNGPLIRPMLGVTRQQVLAFLKEYSIPWVEDSSNAGDEFLRNRLRHGVMPLLAAENPKIGENLSNTAQRLRLDEEALEQMAQTDELPSVSHLRTLPEAVQSRILTRFLQEWGVPEPESRHIDQARSLLYTSKPSARLELPGGVVICRNYDRLEPLEAEQPRKICPLEPGQCLELGRGLCLRWRTAQELICSERVFTFQPVGQVRVRSRQAGDRIRLRGGSKELKKIFIDRKIPAALRPWIPVVCDDAGIIGVYGVGMNLDRAAQELPAVQLCFEQGEA